jgi:gluconolactonase
VTVVAPDGSSYEHLPMPDMLVTNICFGGPDLTTAYVTMSGTGQLGAGQWSGPGLALAHSA